MIPRSEPMSTNFRNQSEGVSESWYEKSGKRGSNRNAASRPKEQPEETSRTANCANINKTSRLPVEGVEGGTG